ncbi:MAG TPA: hypothetical protein VIT92_03700, partial [Burkholderiaceae bacterium]
MAIARPPTHSSLADTLHALVLQHGTAAGVSPFPSIDLAIAAFPPNAPPVYANVLFSREHPQGVIADIGPQAGSVRNIHFVSDLRDDAGNSLVWPRGADWNALPWRTLQAGPDTRQRMVAPYPASLLKTMVALGVGLAIDGGRADWQQAATYENETCTVAAWCERMLTISCNTATSAMVMLLHRTGDLTAEGGPLQHALTAWGLHTLRIADTTAAGGWRNADGSGVGHIEMTAWDAVRLFWLLDAAAPAPPWLAADAPRLSSSSTFVLRAM